MSIFTTMPGRGHLQIRHRRPILSQVEINRRNPMTQNLHCYYEMGHELDSTPDITGDNEPAIIEGQARMAASQKGPAMETGVGDTGDGAYATIASFERFPVETYAMLIQRIDHDAGNQRLFGMDDAYECKISASGSIYTNDLHQAASLNTTSTKTNIVDEWCTLVFTANLDTTVARIYENGIEIADSLQVDDDMTGTGIMGLGKREGSLAADALKGFIVYFAHWSREFTWNEAWSFSQDPYQILRPRATIFHIPVVAGAGGVATLLNSSAIKSLVNNGLLT